MANLKPLDRIQVTLEKEPNELQIFNPDAPPPERFKGSLVDDNGTVKVEPAGAPYDRVLVDPQFQDEELVKRAKAQGLPIEIR